MIKQMLLYDLKKVGSGTVYSGELESLRHNPKRTSASKLSHYCNQGNFALQPEHVQRTPSDKWNFHIMTFKTSVNNVTIEKK